MNWKEFKNWLDKNIVESENLQVKIKPSQQAEYGQISTFALTNFCDSLEASLDQNNTYHLFPEFQLNKTFAELFSSENTYFGKRTNQEKLSIDDYNGLAKLFNNFQKDYKNIIVGKNDMNEIRNILLIGRTGGGKSTLANVLTGTNDFVESSRTTSQTRTVEEGVVEIDIDNDGNEKRKYRVIDTIGIGDTKLKPQGVLIKLAEMAGRVKKEGLNHILFVTKGRFSKEEIEAYDLLSSIIFDKNVLKYTTIVRTGFPEFEDKEACEDDRAALRIENPDLAHILGSVNIVYLDNPPLKGRAKAVEDAKECREESRKRLLTYLAGCQGNYRPSNIDTLDERVNDYKTNEEKLKEKMKEIEADRKRQEEEFRKKIADLKEEQAKELRENRIKFEEDVRKVKVEGEENLRKTKTEMEEKQRRDMEDLERRNQERERQIRDAHEREARSIKEAGEQQMRTIQAQVQQSQQETERLRKELSEKSSSSNNDIAVLLAQMKADDRKWEERREQQRQESEQRREDQRWEYQQQQAKLEEKRIQADKEIAQQRIDAENKAKDDYQSTIGFLNQQLSNQKEENKKLKNKNQEQAEEIDYQVKNNAYIVEQGRKWGINRDYNWDKGISRDKK